MVTRKKKGYNKQRIEGQAGKLQNLVECPRCGRVMTSIGMTNHLRAHKLQDEREKKNAKSVS